MFRSISSSTTSSFGRRFYSSSRMVLRPVVYNNSSRSISTRTTITATSNSVLTNCRFNRCIESTKKRLLLQVVRPSTGPPAILCSNSSNYRALSSNSTTNKEQPQQQQPEGKKDGGGGEVNNDDETTNNEIVLTPGEKVVVASRLTMWIGIASFALVCGYYIVKELIPTKMSPNRVFDRSLEVVRNDSEVKRRYGDTIKGYGRDHGGHREGRRNFIEHTEYTDPNDNSKRTRIRYNIEGRFGSAFVFAEVSSDMDSGEFVYILVQDKSNGHVHTIIDNRAALTAKQLSGGNTQAVNAISQLLSGGSNK